ncbi:hypothetical protein AAGY26_13535 [Staphylococcus aureus]
MDKSLEINLKELESIMYKEKVIDVKEYDNLKGSSSFMVGR